MTCCPEEVTTSGSISATGGTMGPLNRVGRLKMLLSLQMVGLCIPPTVNLGPSETYPMPVVGVRQHGRVGKWVSPWDWTIDTLPIRGPISLAPPITFL